MTGMSFALADYAVHARENMVGMPLPVTGEFLPDATAAAPSVYSRPPLCCQKELRQTWTCCKKSVTLHDAQHLLHPNLLGSKLSTQALMQT